MSTAVESRRERIYCLQNVLKLDPENSAARHDLKLLGVASKTENGNRIKKQPDEDWETRGIATPKASDPELAEEESWSLSWVFSSMGLGLALIFFGYFLASSGLLGAGAQVENAPPTPIAAQTATVDPLLNEYPQMAEAHLEAGEPEQAIDLLEAYLSQETGDASTWQLLGLSYWQIGNQQVALEAFAHALELDANLPQAAYYTGVAYMAQGDTEMALQYLPIATSAAPDWFEARVALSEAFLKSGDPGKAFIELNSGSGMAHSNEQWAALYYWRATILDALGRPNIAVPDWLSLMALPSDAVPGDWRQTAQQRLQVE